MAIRPSLFVGPPDPVLVATLQLAIEVVRAIDQRADAAPLLAEIHALTDNPRYDEPFFRTLHCARSHRNSVGGLTRNYGSDATPRILHITTAPGDQMDMRMVNRLSGYFAAIHTNVKPLHRTALATIFARASSSS